MQFPTYVGTSDATKLLHHRTEFSKLGREWLLGDSRCPRGTRRASAGIPEQRGHDCGVRKWSHSPRDSRGRGGRGWYRLGSSGNKSQAWRATVKRLSLCDQTAG